MTPLSLTRDEAASRSSLLSVERYDIHADMTGLLEGELFASTSTVTFTCTSPGASTFVDIAADVRAATLNGVALDVTTAADGRLPLPDLAERNVLVVEAETTNTAAGEGILRTVDPTDGLVYVWTSLETDEARRLWACFDQPDLKAPHRFTVLAPASWTVTSNGAPDSVEDAESGDARVWSFPDTPPLSTYVVVVNAGPFHEVRQQHDGYDLGFYCRRSLRAAARARPRRAGDPDPPGAGVLRREVRPALPAGALRPGVRAQPRRRDGELGLRDLRRRAAVPHPADPRRSARSAPRSSSTRWRTCGSATSSPCSGGTTCGSTRPSPRGRRCWGLANATEFTEIWASFLALYERTAYEMDMGPGTHPIRGEVHDVAGAMANFDAITYVKGQGVLHQLAAYIGEDAFVARPAGLLRPARVGQHPCSPT